MINILSSTVNNQNIDYRLLLIATMNYGQFQRWSAFVPLEYKIEVRLDYFFNSFDESFSKRRSGEIEDDEIDLEFDELFPEIPQYHKVGCPNLKELVFQHAKLAVDILKFYDYDLLHSVLSDCKSAPHSDFCYSVNSLDDVQIKKDTIILKGICFQSEYVEHTYNYDLPTKHALLKPLNH